MVNACNSRINSQTNRCVLRSGHIGKHLRGRPISCASTYNSKTKRCRRTSVRPRKDIKSSKSKQFKSDKKSRKCALKKSRKRKSRKSRRCKKTKSSSKSRQICRKSKPENQPQKKKLTKVPVHLSSLLDNTNELRKRWSIEKKLGSGANGSVYRACKDHNSRDCEYVIKVQRYNGEAKAEFKAYTNLRGTRLTPTLHAAWKYGNKMYMVLDCLFTCRPRLTYKKVHNMLLKLEQLGWLHVDTHSDNVMCTKSGKAVFIDFGWAVRVSELPVKGHPSGAKNYTELKEIQDSNILA